MSDSAAGAAEVEKIKSSPRLPMQQNDSLKLDPGRSHVAGFLAGDWSRQGRLLASPC
jgi:hypothetical protein